MGYIENDVSCRPWRESPVWKDQLQGRTGRLNREPFARSTPQTSPITFGRWINGPQSKQTCYILPEYAQKIWPWCKINIINLSSLIELPTLPADHWDGLDPSTLLQVHDNNGPGGHLQEWIVLPKNGYLLQFWKKHAHVEFCEPW